MDQAKINISRICCHKK